MPYLLLAEFERVFRRGPYRHRRSTQGDSIATKFYEDLLHLNRSGRLTSEIREARRVVNNQNKRRGVIARRGDGTFGELVPGSEAVRIRGFDVCRGQVATIDIGIEVKVLAKAMIKQIDRVKSDLVRQKAQFLKKGNPICVAVVGINHADYTIGFEGNRRFKTDGKKHKHPYQEAREAELRVKEEIMPLYDELVLLRFKARNERPYDFSWLDTTETEFDYAAALTRVTRLWEQRF